MVIIESRWAILVLPQRCSCVHVLVILHHWCWMSFYFILNRLILYVLEFIFALFWFDLKGGVTQRNRQRETENVSSTGSLFQIATTANPGSGCGASPRSPCGCRERKPSDHLPPPPRHMSKEVVWVWSSWNLNHCSDGMPEVQMAG